MKSDDRVVLFLLVCLGIIMGMFWIVDTMIDGPVQSGDVAVKEQPDRQEKYYSDIKPAEKHLVRFDPNTADSTTLLGLGLAPWMVRAVYKYRAKGGVYRSAEDFARVPGLTKKQFRELLPYIYIGDDYRPAAESFARGRKQEIPKASQKDSAVCPRKLTESERISVNTADTNELKRVPGIGSYFAGRIVTWRERLGGFTSVEQILEIKDFPESALMYFSIGDGEVRKIDINKADFKTLSAHPYIGYKRTKAIFDYRRLKGPITSLEQLSLLPGFSEEERERMEPYVVF